MDAITWRPENPAPLLGQPPEALPYPAADILVQRLSSPRIQENHAPQRPPAGRSGWASRRSAPTSALGIFWLARSVAVSTWTLGENARRRFAWRSSLQPSSTLPVLRFFVAGDLGQPGTCTDTYSPAAMDIAPATRAANPAIRTLLRLPWAAATPKTRLAVDRRPSFAPSTAARSHPVRPARCRSICRTCMFIRASQEKLIGPVIRGRCWLYRWPRN